MYVCKIYLTSVKNVIITKSSIYNTNLNYDYVHCLSLDFAESCKLCIVRSCHRRCFVRKGFLRNFAKFTGKHQCQSLSFNKVVDLKPATLILQNS